MSDGIVRRSGLVCASVVAFVLLIVLARVTASSPTVFEACINPGNGMMRLVDSSTTCHARETRISWNSEGPVGPQGPPGPQGEPGVSSAGGPPFVWVCTPANYDIGNNSSAE